MRTIKRFEVLSVMRISAICYGLMGLLEGAIFSAVFLVMPMASPSQQQMPPWMGAAFGGLSSHLLPHPIRLDGSGLRRSGRCDL